MTQLCNYQQRLNTFDCSPNSCTTDENYPISSMIWCESVEAQETNFHGKSTTFCAYAIRFSSLYRMCLCVVCCILYRFTIQSNFSQSSHSFTTMKPSRSLLAHCVRLIILTMHRMEGRWQTKNMNWLPKEIHDTQIYIANFFREDFSSTCKSKLWPEKKRDLLIKPPWGTVSIRYSEELNLSNQSSQSHYQLTFKWQFHIFSIF